MSSDGNEQRKETALRDRDLAQRVLKAADIPPNLRQEALSLLHRANHALDLLDAVARKGAA